MPWVRLDDHIDEHPKLAAIGPYGLALFVSGLAYCNRNLTDGFIPRNAAHSLLAMEWTDGDNRLWKCAGTCGMTGRDMTCEMIAEVLIFHGLWKRTKGGYRIHDYDHYQPMKAQVLAGREAARKRMSARRSASSGEVQAKFGRSSAAPVPVLKKEKKDPPPSPPRPKSGGRLPRTPSVASDPEKIQTQDLPRKENGHTWSCTCQDCFKAATKHD